MSAALDWGWLGEASLFNGKVTLGVVLGRAELYTGWDYLDVGDTQIKGLLAGVRLWF